MQQSALKLSTQSNDEIETEMAVVDADDAPRCPMDCWCNSANRTAEAAVDNCTTVFDYTHAIDTVASSWEAAEPEHRHKAAAADGSHRSLRRWRGHRAVRWLDGVPFDALDPEQCGNTMAS